MAMIDNTYSVNPKGQVYKTGSRKALKQSVSNDYLIVSLHRKIKYVHILLAEAFIPNQNNEPIVKHIDGDKSNNNLGNLIWTNHSDRMRESYESGERDRLTEPKARGTKHPGAKFTESDVKNIRRYVSDGLPVNYIAGIYSCGKTAVYNCAKGRTYKEVV